MSVFLFSSSRFSKLEDDDRSKKRVFLFGVLVVLRATAGVTTTEMRFGDVLARIVRLSFVTNTFPHNERANLRAGTNTTLKE